MTTHRRFRRARRRAASALVRYLDQTTPVTERAFIEALHELEAAAARRRALHSVLARKAA